MKIILNLAFWRFIIVSEKFMEDIRISIRLSKEEHISLKIISAKSGISIQDMMNNEIKKIIKKGKYDPKEN